MRTLSEEEVEQVSGGVLPILAAIASFAGHAGVRTVARYYVSRASSAYATYEAAKWLKAR